MKSLEVSLAVMLFTSACGSSSDSEWASVDAVQEEAVIESFEAVPVNGGINPGAKAVKVSTSFVAGTNPCMASHYKYSINQIKIKDVVHVVVNAQPVGSLEFICTMEYNPIVKSLGAIVRSNEMNPVKIIVDNVKERGNNVEVKM